MSNDVDDSSEVARVDSMLSDLAELRSLLNGFDFTVFGAQGTHLWAKFNKECACDLALFYALLDEKNRRIFSRLIFLRSLWL